ncbi:MAG: ribonuclease H-like domain-containing protein [Patescibacteria group bacterium]|nr:ribonuclease H-like domain-containing protein [Patescibacteria group bacterium]MCL5261925.1 ribonuclease H-like domain-containing protein [Patescibacteria group bacterium]
MSKLIFDIETVGENYDTLDETTKESLTRWLKKESVGEEEYEVALEELKAGLGFSPLTGEVVAIGMLDYDQNKGAVYYQAPGQENKDEESDGIKFKQMTEAEMLQAFWEAASKYDEFVTFNGRAFDAPFLMVRSAINKIKPTKDLMSNRYVSSQKFGAVHIDLLDQLTFYGAVRKKGNLHLWSRAFGIESPKAQGVTGDDVGRLFKEKKFLDIAKYNVGDIRATRELYKNWTEYIRM